MTKSLHEDLQRAGVACFPCWLRYNEEKGRYDKGPSVPRGVSWQAVAQHPEQYPGLDWSSGVVGVPVPAGVVILDLDTYKGATRGAVEQYLDCALPWDAAAIQGTVSGGEHYAFRCSWDVSQSTSLDGFDVRAAGKGFICSGEGYTPINFGVFSFANPATLPVLPDACRAVLERRSPSAKPAPAPVRPHDGREVAQALRHIDPGCTRAEWVRVGCALKNLFADDDAAGQGLFSAWSAGEFWPAGTPDNFVAEHIEGQWASFKAQGDVTASTLFYKAIQGGWKPPAGFVDAGAAFGAGGASAAEFAELLTDIRRDGCDVQHTQTLIDRIKGAQCNGLQVALLAAELKTELGNSGLKDSAVNEQIDSLLALRATKERARRPGEYGKNDTENAALFLDRKYPDDTLVFCDEEFYFFNGMVWEKIKNSALRGQISSDMAPSYPQYSRVAACFNMLTTKARVISGGMSQLPADKLVFTNGVFDVNTSALTPHTKDYYNTVLHPYDYSPRAPCPQWLTFLDEVLEGDAERIALLQEWIGYLMVNDYRHHKIMLLLGPTRSGKGTVGRVVKKLIGEENFTGGSLSSFARDSYLDSLRTKSAVFMGDAAKRVGRGIVDLVIERVKSISGGDDVDFHRMYNGSLSETLPSRITIASNSIPNLFDDSGALASRIMVLPFYKSFYGHEDLLLTDKLLGELRGIASWALEGLRRLRAAGRFTEPAASRAEVEYIRNAYSPLTQYLRGHCDTGEGLSCTVKDLFDAYRSHAGLMGEEPMRMRTFIGAVRDSMRAAGIHFGVLDGEEGFTGIRPRPVTPFEPRIVAKNPMNGG